MTQDTVVPLSYLSPTPKLNAILHGVPDTPYCVYRLVLDQVHLFLLSFPGAYHPTPRSYNAHWENTFITASRAMNDYLLDLEYATHSLVTTRPVL